MLLTFWYYFQLIPMFHLPTSLLTSDSSGIVVQYLEIHNSNFDFSSLIILQLHQFPLIKPSFSSWCILFLQLIFTFKYLQLFIVPYLKLATNKLFIFRLFHDITIYLFYLHLHIAPLKCLIKVVLQLFKDIFS